MNARQTVFAAASVALMLVALSTPALADASSAAETLLSTFEDAITGSIGFFIGLGVTLLGLWTWIIKQDTGAGITMIIGGVLLTMLPQVFNGAQELVSGVMESISSSNRVGGL